MDSGGKQKGSRDAPADDGISFVGAHWLKIEAWLEESVTIRPTHMLGGEISLCRPRRSWKMMLCTSHGMLLEG